MRNLRNLLTSLIFTFALVILPSTTTLAAEAEVVSRAGAIGKIIKKGVKKVIPPTKKLIEGIGKKAPVSKLLELEGDTFRPDATSDTIFDATPDTGMDDHSGGSGWANPTLPLSTLGEKLH